MTLEWKDPPTPRSGPGSGNRWSEIADELRRHPGEWARVASGVNARIGVDLRVGRYKSWPAGEFEVTVRGTGQGSRVTDIYARYVGGVTRE